VNNATIGHIGSYLDQKRLRQDAAVLRVSISLLRAPADDLLPMQVREAWGMP
jgi:hypothetical protein